MRRWTLELRKHGRFFAFAILLLAATLSVQAATHTTVSSITWMFAMMLIPTAAAAYTIVTTFGYLVAGSDLLVHLSTLDAWKKYLLKTIPAFCGMAMMGILTLTGYLFASGGGHAPLATYLYAYAAKLASIAAFVSTTWLLCRLVAHLPGRSAQVAVWGLAFAALVAIEIVCLSSVYPLGAQWSVGPSSDFVGLPLYTNILPITLETNGWNITPGMNVTLAANIATSVICLLLEAATHPRGDIDTIFRQDPTAAQQPHD